MEICVNDYIRTKDGRIDKVTDIANNYILVKSKIKIFEYGESYAFIKKSDILKHSSNIIDLIEVRRLCKSRKDFRYNRRLYINN